MHNVVGGVVDFTWEYEYHDACRTFHRKSTDPPGECQLLHCTATPQQCLALCSWGPFEDCKMRCRGSAERGRRLDGSAAHSTFAGSQTL